MEGTFGCGSSCASYLGDASCPCAFGHVDAAKDAGTPHDGASRDAKADHTVGDTGRADAGLDGSGQGRADASSEATVDADGGGVERDGGAPDSPKDGQNVERDGASSLPTDARIDGS